MIEILKTAAYVEWISALRDRRAVARINQRLLRLQAGNPGQVEPVGEGVSELKIDYGPGYRVYYLNRGDELVILLGGGDKQSQRRDIKNALELARDIRERGYDEES